MDFNNLLNIQYNIKYDQNKLQEVLKKMEAKMNSMDLKMQELKINDDQRHQKLERLQTFTIDNMRLTVNEFKQLKVNLRLFLGDKYTQFQKKRLQQSSSNNLSSILQSQIEQFTAQTKQLQKKVTDLKVQLGDHISHHSQQANQIKNEILQKQHKITDYMTSIEAQVKKKIEQLRTEFEQKFKKQIDSAKRIISAQGIRRSNTSDVNDEQGSQDSEDDYDQQEKVFLNNLQKMETKENDALGDTTNLASNIDVPTNKKLDQDKLKTQQKNEKRTSLEQKQVQKMAKIAQEFKEDQIKSDFASAHSKPKRQKNKNKPSKKKVTYQKDVVYTQDQIEAKNITYICQNNGQPYQNYLKQLNQQFNKMINEQLLEIQTKLKINEEKNDKIQLKVSELSNGYKQISESLQKNQQKIRDNLDQIYNLRNTVYENTENQKELKSKSSEHDDKIKQISMTLNQLSRDLFYRSNQSSQKQIPTGRQAIVPRDLNVVKRSSREENLPSLTALGGIKSHISISRNHHSGTPSLRGDDILGQRVDSLSQRLSKIQEKMYKAGLGASQKNLPKIQQSVTSVMSSKVSSTLSVELLRKDISSTNEELNKTNERLSTLKKNLKQLQSAHSLIPKKLESLELKINDVNDLQQERLLQLIKQLINRVLTDPFDNNFTNKLKSNIQVRFLEIRHQYQSLSKDIQNKVADRADMAELKNIKEKFETQILQAKALINKKAQTQDFKKAMKYLQGKVKDLYDYVKGQDEKNQTSKKYYMGKV